ncbi:hypothetical protein SAMN05660649_04780 [Desulfotomaculum arcticum]|uniref:Uncharacterized protein n=1 Tax=Desulfotruncus arcticus DSM 17038 TaxID=1121424 RepID=A0A1I2Z6H2_9FIRM|nr:hypothetical protein [Desulfotruncus arcticus]SFH33467.1 hypothetical protein SAMN05660649_04780 [Desulfotomaculum arcticum] [Desulfotruncus arcticus DSM 17038]
MNMSLVFFPEALRQKLGDDASKSLIEVINQATKDLKESTLEIVIEKIERRLADTKTEIIKWMFIFWVGQLAAMFAMLKMLI